MDEGMRERIWVFFIPKCWGFVVLSDVFLVHLSCWQIAGKAKDGGLSSFGVVILLVKTHDVKTPPAAGEELLVL